jgi:cytidylate kinase
LRVRLIGPLQDRIAAIQRRYGATPEEAARWVEQTDRERKEFVVEHFSKDPTDPHQYDVLLEAFCFQTAQCAEIIVTSLRMLQDRAGK